MLCFILSTAVRRSNTQPQFNSMLIHVVRFTLVQGIVKEEVERELTSIRSRLLHGDEEEQAIRDELKSLWDTDYVPTSRKCGAPLPSWADIDAYSPEVASAIQVRIIDSGQGGAGRSGTPWHRTVADRRQQQQLARGLTLEGLTVSYFLRASECRAPSMQMGRWFGYREGYIDVCRLCTTSDLVSWFEHIASATEELRMEFDYMFSIRATPREYGLKVRAHPVLVL